MEEMMNLETMNEEMETEVVETELEPVAEDYVEPEESGSDIVGKVIVGGLVVVGTAAVLFRKKIKQAIKNHNIKKLQKEGYTILGPNEVIEATVSDAEEVAEDESDSCEEVED